MVKFIHPNYLLKTAKMKSRNMKIYGWMDATSSRRMPGGAVMIGTNSVVLLLICFSYIFNGIDQVRNHIVLCKMFFPVKKILKRKLFTRK